MTHTPFPAATIVGYPRVGRFRELKKAQEAFWKGKITQDELRQAAADVQRTYYDRVIERGLSATDSSIPATFSYAFSPSCPSVLPTPRMRAACSICPGTLL